MVTGRDIQQTVFPGGQDGTKIPSTPLLSSQLKYLNVGLDPLWGEAGKSKAPDSQCWTFGYGSFFLYRSRFTLLKLSMSISV